MLAALFLIMSCSEGVPELKVNPVQAQKVNVKNTVPSCCAKKPSRFAIKNLSKETLR